MLTSCGMQAEQVMAGVGDSHLNASWTHSGRAYVLHGYTNLLVPADLGVNAAGEALFAGLLPDYFRQGEMDKSRGFAAHYAAGAAYLKANLPGGNYVSLTLGVRKWFFRNENEALRLLRS